MPQLNPLFRVNYLNALGGEKAQSISQCFSHLLCELESGLIPISSRESALTRTHLELACFFAKKAMSSQPENQTDNQAETQAPPTL